MILINFTGLDHFHWIPRFQRDSDGNGLWYASAQWLNVQVSTYSVAMASEMISRFNGMIKNSQDWSQV